jgi:serine/threonine-protein kinase
MGTVWLAHDSSLDAECAVKLIDEGKSADEEIRTRFSREAKASAQLRSAHVVDVFDYGEWAGTHYIAMEYLDGEDLSTRLDRLGQLDGESTYRIIAHVARALMSAHALGIVHRDLKPENIFLVQRYDEEIAKVLDFGIAQNSAYSLENRATREGTFLGTPCYMSPEQARGKPVDHRSDLWSLGVIAFQCLTGQLPFDSEALGELMGMILYEPIPKASDFNKELPPGIDGWWERASARDREQRFQSAKSMADELGVLLGVRTGVTVPTVPPRFSSAFPAVVEKSGVVTAPKVRELRQRLASPEPRAAQWSVVQEVAAGLRTLDAQAPDVLEPEVGPRIPLARAALAHIDKRLKQLVEIYPRSKRLALAIPFGVLLVVLSVMLGFLLRGRPANTLPAPGSSSLAIVRGDAPKGIPSPISAAPVPDTLTVDMLPLVSPKNQSGKGAAEPGRNNSELGPRKSEPASNHEPSPRLPKSARDYGI